MVLARLPAACLRTVAGGRVRRAAVEVVERFVEVPVAAEVTPRREESAPLLRELTAQVDDGGIYARDLPDLGTALTDLLAAYNRRQITRRIRH